MNAYLEGLGKNAKAAATTLGAKKEQQKNEAILKIAEVLEASIQEILEANTIDVENLIAAGKNLHMKDRLALNEKRIRDMAEGARQVVALQDPVGEQVEEWARPNGLQIKKVRVPLGVIGIIYESRPNVTVDAAMLCLKTGNAVILRGGKEALQTNLVLIQKIQEALNDVGFDPYCVQLITDNDREVAAQFMRMNGYVDVLIPRGGAGLIRAVVEQATIPVIETGTGNCHTYVDVAADLDMATEIILNAKTQRPSVCNAMETLLVHRDIAATYLPVIARALQEKNVELRGCETTCQILEEAGVTDVKVAAPSDWATEYNDLILAVKVVADVQEAVAHIATYGTRHSECIVSKEEAAVRYFQQMVDASCVYANASTRFTDGFEFGFGAEIGISNQKLHARGPMGLKELTTTKYVISGNGQVRT